VLIRICHASIYIYGSTFQHFIPSLRTRFPGMITAIVRSATMNQPETPDAASFRFFQRCKDLAGDDSAPPWTKDRMFGFFQAFRPDGHRLASLFADIPSGDLVYGRLQQAFSATATGAREHAHEDAYFVVRSSEPAPPESLVKSAVDQLANWRLMAEAIGERELVDLLTPLPRVTRRSTIPPPPDPNDTESLDVFIYDVQCDWHGGLPPLCPHASWMRDAVYSIACDYYLAHYITWPWYVHSSPFVEPFGPYFALWRHGVTLRCQSPQDVTLFLGTPDHR